MLSEEYGVQPEAFAAPGPFYKGNLHTHSNRSDGGLDPEEVCRRYREQGYDFLALTDHFVGIFNYPIVDTTPFRTNAFTTILGAEVHSGRMRNGELWHLVAIGLPADFEPPHAPKLWPSPEDVEKAESAATLARRAVEAGAFVAIAHPQWSGLSLEDALEIDAAHAVEIYNHGCAIDSDRSDGTVMLDMLLERGRRLTVCATDDAHFRGAGSEAQDAFGGWTMVKAGTLTPEALLESLRAGRHYASQGPEIVDLRFDGSKVSVLAPQTDAPISRVTVVGAASAANTAYHESFERTPDGVIASVPLGRVANSPWMRVVVIDASGKRAWTNPIWRA